MIDKPTSPIEAMRELDRKGIAYVVTIELAHHVPTYERVDVYAYSNGWMLVGFDDEKAWLNTAVIHLIKIHEI